MRPIAIAAAIAAGSASGSLRRRVSTVIGVRTPGIYTETWRSDGSPDAGPTSLSAEVNVVIGSGTKQEVPCSAGIESSRIAH